VEDEVGDGGEGGRERRVGGVGEARDGRREGGTNNTSAPDLTSRKTASAFVRQRFQRLLTDKSRHTFCGANE